MEASSDIFTSSSSNRYGIPSASHIIQAPLSLLLEYFGILRSRSNNHHDDDAEPLVNNYRLSSSSSGFRDRLEEAASATGVTNGDAEVAISILGSGEQQRDQNEVSESAQSASVTLSSDNQERGSGGEGVSQSVNANSDGEASEEGVGVGGGGGGGTNARDSSPYERYDVQQAARWIEQVLPFSLLLLVVFIRQHLRGTLMLELLLLLISVNCNSNLLC